MHILFVQLMILPTNSSLFSKAIVELPIAGDDMAVAIRQFLSPHYAPAPLLWISTKSSTILVDSYTGHLVYQMQVQPYSTFFTSNASLAGDSVVAVDKLGHIVKFTY